MQRPTKKQFYDHMSSIYGKYTCTKGYKTMSEIFDAADDVSLLLELEDLIDMDKKQRLLYRYALACGGKELTPLQLDQYISIVEYALNHIED